jgi:uncharacterized membrane protein HdeD (DUF308 family)
MVSHFSVMGLILSVSGGILDFAVLFFLLLSWGQSAGPHRGIDATYYSNIAIYVVVFLLLFGFGLVLLVAGVFGVTPMIRGRTKYWGKTMVLNGILMLVLGGILLLGKILSLEVIVMSLVMLSVGFCLIIYGLLMKTRHKMNI